MRSRRFAHSFLLLASTVLVLYAMMPKPAVSQAPTQITTSDRESAQAMLSDVRDTLKKNYYDPSFHGIDLDDRYEKYKDQIKHAKTLQAAYRVVEAYVVGLNDSHTAFIPPQNTKRVTYGFQLKTVGSSCFITHLQPGSDAEQKLHPGDEVLSLDGYAINRQDLWQLEYYLQYLPPRLTTDFTVRDISGNVRRESVVAEFEEGPAFRSWSESLYRMDSERWQHNIRSRVAEQNDIFFWKLASFNEDEGSLSQMLGEARKYKAMVIDLRENGGGSESNLLSVLGGLFDHDVTVGTQVMRKKQKPLIAKSRGQSAFAGKLVVLIDSRSASAAELLARVVQLEHRGRVVGDRSAGSVMAAQVFPLRAHFGPGYGAEVTVADLIMADGKSLEHVGVTPDDFIVPSAADLAAEGDPVLSHAADLLGAKIDSLAAGKMFPFEWPSKEPIH